MLRYQLHIGDALSVARTLRDSSVDCVITSPPYFRQRTYLPSEDPAAALEMGKEPTPGQFLDALLDLMDELWRVMTPDATFWVNLGDKHAGSGGAGGDYNQGGLRAGQPRYGKAKASEGWPSEQSVCWLPDLFGASLAYGRNLLLGTKHRQWVTRPAVTWCKPSPPVGELTRRFRTATELIVYGGKHQGHYFDLDAVRTPHLTPPTGKPDYTQAKRADPSRGPGGDSRGFMMHHGNPQGAPPLNWWLVGSGGGYDGPHFATYPPELLVKPVLAGCPAGGTILDPFLGSGTTMAVAHGNSRSCTGIDLDRRNADLVCERLGLWAPEIIDHFSERASA